MFAIKCLCEKNAQNYCWSHAYCIRFYSPNYACQKKLKKKEIDENPRWVILSKKNRSKPNVDTQNNYIKETK